VTVRRQVSDRLLSFHELRPDPQTDMDMDISSLSSPVRILLEPHLYVFLGQGFDPESNIGRW